MKAESSFRVFPEEEVDASLIDETQPATEEKIVFKLLRLVMPLELVSGFDCQQLLC